MSLIISPSKTKMKLNAFRLTGLILLIVPLFSFAQLKVPENWVSDCIKKADFVLEGTPYKYTLERSSDDKYDHYYFYLTVTDNYKGRKLDTKTVLVKRTLHHYSRPSSHGEQISVFPDVRQVFSLKDNGETREGMPVLDYIDAINIHYTGCDHKVCGNGGLRYDDMDAFYGFLRDLKLNIPNEKFTSYRLKQNKKKRKGSKSRLQIWKQ